MAAALRLSRVGAAHGVLMEPGPSGVADDPEFTQNVRTLFNNDHDNSSGLGRGEDTAFLAGCWGELVDTRGPDYDGIMARCVRIWTNGGEADEPTRFVEISVYGLPPGEAVAGK